MEKDIRWVSIQKTEVLTAAYSPDGRTVAVAGFDRTVYLLDTTTWKVKKELREHGYAVSQVSFSLDGQILASLSPGESPILWDVNNGKELRRLQGDSSKKVNALAFTGDGKALITTSSEKAIRVWDVKTGREVKTLPSHEGEVIDVAISPDGKLLAAGGGVKGKSGTIQLWDTTSWKVVDVLKGHSDRVRSLSFSGDGKYLATSGADGKLFIWDMTRRNDKPLVFPHQIRSRVCFSPKRDQVAFVKNHDQHITIWDFHNKKETPSPGPFPFLLNCLTFSPDGRSLVFVWGGRPGDLGLWEIPENLGK